MSLVNGFLVVSSITGLVYLLGLHNYLNNYEDNACTMTYMFEYPQFVRISLPANVSLKFKRFGLYAYGEGRQTERVRQMRFSGIPVLFVPGSRGSPKQVRSLASVSLRKTIGSRTPYHFDYFALDLNDDNPGLFGGALEEQTEFLKECIERISSLYKTGDKSQSIVLIGHSIGGLIVKGLFMDKTLESWMIKIVITLSTPHSPALLTDHLLARYYDQVSTYWKEHGARLRANMTVISLGGGRRDVIVRSGLTLTKDADINALVTDVSDVWLSTDHYCILWCKELVLVLVRALFDSVDLNTKQIMDDPRHRLQVFKYHLLERSAGKKYTKYLHQGVMQLWDGTPDLWVPVEKNQYTWSKPNGVATTTYLVIPLLTITDTMLIVAVNHNVRDWVFVCTSDTSSSGVKTCKQGYNLSSQGRITPTKHLRRKKIILDMARLRMAGNTHIVVKTLPTTDPVQVSFDMFRKKERTIAATPSYFKSATVIEKTPTRVMYYNVEPQPMTRVFHNFYLNIESPDCNVPNLALVQVKIPWNNEGSSVIVSGQKGRVPIMMHSPKPVSKEPRDVSIELTLNPECTYSVVLDKSLLSGLGVIIGRCGVSVLSSVAVCLLMTLSAQLKLLEEKSCCPLLHFVMPDAVKPYYIMPAFSVVGAFARFIPTMVPWIPGPDANLNDGLMDTFFIPVFIHCTAFAIAYFLACFALIAVIFYGHTFNNFILKFLSKFVYGLTWMSEYIVSGAYKVPIVVSAIMVGLTCSACAGLALSLGLVFYFFKLVSLYEDFWQEIIYFPVRLLKAKLFRKASDSRPLPKFEIPPINEISYHLTLILLWAVTSLITVPSLLAWAKNYRYSTKLEPDPFFFHGMLMSLCAGVLWQAELPRPKLAWSKEVSQLIFCLCVFVMVYAQSSLHRLINVLTAVFVCVTLHQFVAPWFSQSEPNEETICSWDDSSEVSQDEEDEEDSCQEECAEREKSLKESVSVSKAEQLTEEDKTTPSSEVSNSSFENLSLKEVKEPSD